MAQAKERVIGIDLGTTNSCAAMVRGGRPEVIPNAEGERVTPSAVVFSDGEVLVGQMAKRQSLLSVDRTVLSVKRKMGTDWRFDVSRDGKDEQYSPEQVSAFVLQKMKRDAEDFLGGEVQKAVITVPAYFNNLQRQATKDAGKIAGLEVLRIINEPTAAALAYGLDRQQEEQTILVYDLGGGTFDVSILELGDGVFEVVSSDGDTQLGGDDFDQRIMDWLVEEFRKDTGIDLSKDPAAMQRLRDAAEGAKKELSSRMETKISLPYLTADATGPKHLEKTLSRAKMESMIEDLIQQTMSIVDATLDAGGKRPEDIHQVVLVGGCTRIPKVQELVAQRFTKGKINRDINPDEVVALGAAVQSAILAGEMDEVVLLDVTPLTLSIETLGGVATPIIERNTTIPVERSKTFTTAEDYQSQVEIHVVQGERKMAADNKSLGRFVLSDLPPAPRGTPQIDVVFSINTDGILEVTAKDKGTSKTASITIKETSRLSEEEIKRMQKEAEEHAEEDRRRAEEIEARNEADQLVYSVEKSLSELGEKVPASKRGEIEGAIRDVKQKLESGADAASLRSSVEALKKAAGEMAAAAYQQAGEGPSSAGESEDGGTEQASDYIDYEKE